MPPPIKKRHPVTSVLANQISTARNGAVARALERPRVMRLVRGIGAPPHRLSIPTFVGSGISFRCIRVEAVGSSHLALILTIVPVRIIAMLSNRSTHPENRGKNGCGFHYFLQNASPGAQMRRGDAPELTEFCQRKQRSLQIYSALPNSRAMTARRRHSVGVTDMVADSSFGVRRKRSGTARRRRCTDFLATRLPSKPAGISRF